MNGDQYQPHYSNSSDPSDPTVSTATLNDSSDKISALSKIIENVDLNSPECQELLKDYETPKAFDKVGFARSLGGFFYQFFYALIGGVIIAVTYGFILKVLYPFPEGKAYTTVGNVLFSLLFLIMNIPTNFAIERFIGEHRVKNPAKMVQYIRFYIWYQMMTGVFLVAGTSIYVLYIMQTGNLMYTKWLLLIYISREFPATTQIFITSIRGLQQFHYESRLNFLNDSVVKLLCEISFVLFGRFVLGANPQIGEIMGITIGYSVGTYAAELIMMFFSMIYFKKCLAPFGYTLKDVFIPRVEKDVWLTSLKFGIALSPPGIVSTIVGLFTFFWWYDMVPAYATLLILSQTADDIANLMKRGGGINVKATMSEAFNNGKKHLTQYYIAMMLKFVFLFKFAIGAVILTFIPIVVDLVLRQGGVENWALAAAFIAPNVIATVVEEPVTSADHVILGANRPWFKTLVDFIGIGIALTIDVLLLFVFQWPQRASLSQLIWIIPMTPFIKNIIILTIQWIYIDRKIVKVNLRQFGWQTFIAPIVPAGCVALVGGIWFKFAYEPLLATIGTLPTAAITVIIGFMCLLWVFFPLYTFFGGWDDYSIDLFHEAVQISGPSKFLFIPIDRANKTLKNSKLHNRFPIPYEDARREAEEIMKEKFIKDKINQMIIEQSAHQR
jgi:hypothetical protein